jgi:hypothetical protein
MQTLRRWGFASGLMVLILLVVSAPLLAGPDEGLAAVIAFAVFSPLAAMLWVIGITALSAIVTTVKLDRVQREATVVAHYRSTCFWWGLPTGFLLFALFLIFSVKHGPGLMAWALLIFASLALATGFAGVSVAVGHRLLNKAHAYPPALFAAVGSLVLGFAFTVPVAGQALLFYVACLSLGAFRLTWFGKFVAHDKPFPFE